jgi:hypothetical protein
MASMIIGPVEFEGGMCSLVTQNAENRKYASFELLEAGTIATIPQ